MTDGPGTIGPDTGGGGKRQQRVSVSGDGGDFKSHQKDFEALSFRAQEGGKRFKKRMDMGDWTWMTCSRP